MALRRQFLQLVYDLRAELGRSTDPAVGASDLPSLKRTIQRNYETLYQDYDWPHLSMVSEKMAVQPGERYYAFPDEMDWDSTDEVVYWWNDRAIPLKRGIGFDDYSLYDPEDDERSDPPIKYDVRYVGTKEMIELWPLPNTSGEMQFKGTKKFKQLVDDADLCLIDDHLVILHSAVELLPRQKSGDVQIKLAAAQQRYARMKARSKTNTEGFRVGGGQGSRVPNKAVIRISGG